MKNSRSRKLPANKMKNEFDIPMTSSVSQLTSDDSSISSTDGDHPEKKRKVYVTPPKTSSNIVIPLAEAGEEAPSSQLKKKRHLILQYSIDPYEYTDEYLIELSIEMFYYYKLFDFYHFKEENLISLLLAVKELYHPNNNFHNFKHAWGVMHMSFQLLINGVDKCLSSFDIFAVLIAAVCHDVGHPGNNNAFEFATASDVSKQYSAPNENCVLERYHCGLTRKLLFPNAGNNSESSTKRDHRVLEALTEEEREKFFEHVNFIILGTDMAKHGALVEETQSLVQKAKQALSSATSSNDSDCGVSESKKTSDCIPECNNGTAGRSELHLTPKAGRKHAHRGFQIDSPTGVNTNSLAESSILQLFQSEQSRQALTRILVHTADIGAQTQEFSIAYKWVNRCYTEFQTQATKEKQLGIMTSPFLHDLTDDKKIFASQYSFINDIVEPLWSAFTELFPELQFASGQLITNKISYKKYF